MRLIEKMLEEAEKANWSSAQRWQSGQTQKDNFIVAEEYKQMREQWWLGHFVRLYNEMADKLIFAEHLPERQISQPDFAVYDDSRVLRCYIEVTEWLEPYRRRDQEYKGPFEEAAKPVDRIPGAHLPSPIKRLKDQLQKKIREKAPYYPPNTWLLVDDNVGLADYEWADRSLGDVEVARQVFDEMKNELRNISQVWLLREVARPMTVHLLYPVE